MPLERFEPTIPARQLPHSDALDIQIMHFVNFLFVDGRST